MSPYPTPTHDERLSTFTAVAIIVTTFVTIFGSLIAG